MSGNNCGADCGLDAFAVRLAVTGVEQLLRRNGFDRLLIVQQTNQKKNQKKTNRIGERIWAAGKIKLTPKNQT